MSGAYIEVNTVFLKQDTEALRQQIGQAGQCLKDLAADLTGLDAAWRGTANAAFQRQVAEDAEYLSEVIREVTELSACMEYAANEYVKCENDVADMISAVRI